MRRTRIAGRTRKGTRLFVLYAAASCVPVLVLGLVLLHGYRSEAADRATSQGRAQAAVIEEMAIAPVVGPRDLEAGLRPAERRRLIEATDLSAFSGSIVALRVRSFSGRVIFSDDGTVTDGLAASSPAFRRAAAGGTDAALVPDPTDPGRHVLRVLRPVVPNASGQATGVLELYLPYGRIAQHVDAELRRASVRTVAALLVLYLVLAAIAWSSTRALRRHAAEREHRALHDALTGLPNREAFEQHAARRLAAGELGAVALLDLDRFKEVNDWLGHGAGDTLLREVARRLAGAVRAGDLTARLGGDEFGVLLAGATTPEEALAVLRRVHDDLIADLPLEGLTVNVEASIGVALHPRHGTTLDALARAADTAMYRGKRGTESVVLHDPEDAPGERRSLAVVSAFRHALDAGELRLHYQPKIDLATRRICGVEALVRWQHPERGLLGPGAFLPAIERSELVGALTEWVVDRALEDRERWLERGLAWPVSVNVSARNLESPAFVGSLLARLAASATEPGDLFLELTETAFASNAGAAAEALRALLARGVSVSVDDFGMGYSSLSQLRHLAATEIKVDRAFVVGLDERQQDRSIVRSIIELGHALGARVTAEGVESAVTGEWLRAAGCDAAQGFHYARPAPWEELAAHVPPAAAGGAALTVLEDSR